jgi:hypothetical protein
MQQIKNNIMTKLSSEEIEYLIKNPLLPPIQFSDRFINGYYGLLPRGIWNQIYTIKKDMEENDILKRDNFYNYISNYENAINLIKINAIKNNEMGYDLIKYEKFKNNGRFNEIINTLPIGSINYKFLERINNLKRPRIHDREEFKQILENGLERMANNSDYNMQPYGGSNFKKELLLEHFEYIYNINPDPNNKVYVNPWGKYMCQYNRDKMNNYYRKINNMKNKIKLLKPCNMGLLKY